MSHETKIVHGKPLGDSKRWIAQCSCGRRSDSWLDCDDARANLADMHPPSVLPSDPRDDEIAALRARVETAEKDRNDAWKREQTLIDELHDAGGALDDAGVRRHEDDEIASGIEKLAKARDELLDQWIKVGNLFWPNREPDDGWSADEVGDEVKTLRGRVAELEADAKIGRVVREFDAEARDILGRPCFTCGRIAEVLRRMGRTIPPKAEDEQAEVLRWMLGLYAEHGAQWREKGDEELRAALAALEVPRG